MKINIATLKNNKELTFDGNDMFSNTKKAIILSGIKQEKITSIAIELDNGDVFLALPPFKTIMDAEIEIKAEDINETPLAT
jgi:hypothetical protein